MACILSEQNKSARASALLVVATLVAFGAVASFVPASSLAAGQPTVGKLSPPEAREKGGTKLTIKGTNLAGATEVHFGSTSVGGLVVNTRGTSVRVAIPSAQTVGERSVDVTVTTPEGTSAITPADRFTYRLTPPIISRLSTRKGPAVGGTSVEIVGESFFEVSAVDFGSVSATSFTVNSFGSITATSPAETVGPVKVTVTTPAGSSGPGTCTGYGEEGPESIPCPSHERFVFDEPTVTSVSPGTGPAAGGTRVTITGSGFAPGSTDTVFYFGPKSNPATSVECSSITVCTAVTPARAAGKVNVQAKIVTATGVSGSKANAPADQFTYG